MKLFEVSVMDDCEEEFILVVAENELDAVERVGNMDWSCLMSCVAREISEVDGYKIVLEKVGEE